MSKSSMIYRWDRSRWQRIWWTERYQSLHELHAERDSRFQLTDHERSPLRIQLGRSKYIQAHAFDPSVAGSLGLGGVPALGPGQYGLPYGGVSGINFVGVGGTNNEGQNVYQILDNVIWNLGTHSIKAGLSLQAYGSPISSLPHRSACITTTAASPAFRASASLAMRLRTSLRTR